MKLFLSFALVAFRDQLQMASLTYGNMDIWKHGHMGIWIQGYMDIWIYGNRYMETWIYGYMLLSDPVSPSPLPSLPSLPFSFIQLNSTQVKSTQSAHKQEK